MSCNHCAFSILRQYTTLSSSYCCRCILNSLFFIVFFFFSTPVRVLSSTTQSVSSYPTASVLVDVVHKRTIATTLWRCGDAAHMLRSKFIRTTPLPQSFDRKVCLATASFTSTTPAQHPVTNDTPSDTTTHPLTETLFHFQK